MDVSAHFLYFSGIRKGLSVMKKPQLLWVPYREVRHDQPDDCLHYEQIAVRAAEMDWTIPAHRHEGLHQFQFIESGGIRGSIDGREFQAQSPVMLMLAPGAVHGFTYTRDAVGHQVTLPASTLSQLLGESELVQTHLKSSFVISPEDDSVGIAEMFARISREFQRSDVGRVPALLALVALIAVRFIRERGEQFEREAPKGLRDTLLQRYLTLVEQHYAEHRPLTFYSEALRVSADHLSRTCRNLVQKSALEILQERLMLEARRLLAYTPMPIAQVAGQLGYEDAAYFSKSFGRAMGHTPSEYRALVAHGVRRVDAAAP
ncbi:DNA-binding domain-containing protein, AraC-type [Acidovorax sp. CF316]|uniref:helix-turn-helix domain-containing protein n=1 Tax=Acidovorax sp. CF316 TaxID=1144317 RepID=UPI00026BD304|nr:helix-turn-helix domain-containing protein [Acidovorax sp. CF316]EJE53967.1 DNA-binding domain-containing protein, AraC-type [Acidovorax sp. CF316]